MKHRKCASCSVRKRTHRSAIIRHGKGGKVVLKTNKKNTTIVFPPQVASTTNPVQRAFLETVFKHIQRNENSSDDIANAIVDLCKRESRGNMKWVAPEELYQLCVDYAKTVKTKTLEDYMYILDYSYRGYDVFKGKDINNPAHVNKKLSGVFESGHNRSPPKAFRVNQLQNHLIRRPFESLNLNPQRERSDRRSSESATSKTHKSRRRRRRRRNNASKTHKKPSAKPSARSPQPVPSTRKMRWCNLYDMRLHVKDSGALVVKHVGSLITRRPICLQLHTYLCVRLNSLKKFFFLLLLFL